MEAPPNAAPPRHAPPAQRAEANRVEDFYPPSLRGRLRSAALDVIGLGDRFRPLLRDSGPCVQVLLLHHVFEDELEGFDRLLDRLQLHYEFISYSEAVRRVVRNEIDARYLTFSFDDGQKSCLDAAKVLSRYGASGCFFVCPGFLEESCPRRLAEACWTRLRHGPVEFLDYSDLQRLLHDGHEIGGHTYSHVDLGAVGLPEARDEIERCRNTLVSRLGPVKHFAWPYGQWTNITPQTLLQVYQSGFESCASGVRGAHTPGRPWVGFEGAPCLLRDSIQACWPWPHVRYFLGRAVRRGTSTPRRSAA